MADSPTLVEPGQQYLGVTCHRCQFFVSVVGPLDPAQIAPDQPMTVGSRGPLSVECPQCHYRGSYPVTDLRRQRKP